MDIKVGNRNKYERTRNKAHLKQKQSKVEILMEQMAEQRGVTEEVKMQDQMEWVRRMNNIKNVAEESAIKIIYL